MEADPLTIAVFVIIGTGILAIVVALLVAERLGELGNNKDEISRNYYMGKAHKVANNPGVISEALTSYRATQLFMVPKTGETHIIINDKYRSKPELLLLSPTYFTIYSHLAEAVCEAPGFFHKFKEECTCGWHSFKTFPGAYNYSRSSSQYDLNKWGKRSNIVTEVVNSGRYVEYTDGYRSEKIRTKTVYVMGCVTKHHELGTDTTPVALLVSKGGYWNTAGICHSCVTGNKWVADQQGSTIISIEEASNLFDHDPKHKPVEFVVCSSPKFFRTPSTPALLPKGTPMSTIEVRQYRDNAIKGHWLHKFL